MTQRALAYWATGPGSGELRPLELRRPGPDEVLVRALYSGISCGTEALVALGRVPVSQQRVMRAPFQDGEFPFPVKYGYCSVGEVMAGAPALVGRHVFCLYPHQTSYVVPLTAVAPLPDALPPGRAVLAANMETALNAVWDSGARPGERIHVIGAGVVGCLAAWLLARLPGAEVTLADIDDRRAGIAGQLGVTFSLPEGLAGDADLVIHASGNPLRLRRARGCGFEGRVVELAAGTATRRPACRWVRAFTAGVCDWCHRSGLGVAGPAPAMEATPAAWPRRWTC